MAEEEDGVAASWILFPPAAVIFSFSSSTPLHSAASCRADFLFDSAARNLAVGSSSASSSDEEEAMVGRRLVAFRLASASVDFCNSGDREFEAGHVGKQFLVPRTVGTQIGSMLVCEGFDFCYCPS